MGWTLGLVLAIPVFGVSRQADGEITAEKVNLSIDDAVAFLRSRQHRDHGTWAPNARYPGGVTSLCTLALLNAGLTEEDPTVKAALRYLEDLGNPEMTYATALQTMVFCRANPKRFGFLIRRNVSWLESAQCKADSGRGGWSYGGQSNSPDNSNSQFALLALHEAEQSDVPVNQAVWQAAFEYWLRRQRNDGSWGYRAAPSNGSMTCAGLSSVYIASRHMTRGDAWMMDNQVRCCGVQQPDAALERGIAWLGRNFSIQRNPTGSGGASQRFFFYYLYGVERVGRLTGRRFLGRHDWYREGADHLVGRQDRLTNGWKGLTSDESKEEVATAMALLFLSKGRRPVVLAKLRSGEFGDWNRHRGDVPNLTRYVETQWQQELTWQVIDIRAATSEDLSETPVLYISGRDGLQLSLDQKEEIRKYITDGGFIFAEACCDGSGFDRDFRQLVADLFPDSPLELLPPEHPIWFAEKRIPVRYVRPLLGVEACCRTSIVYCPKDLGCYWEMARHRQTDLIPKVQNEVQAVLDIGANVLAYATNRKLREKLDATRPPGKEDPSLGLGRGSFYVPKLSHGGGSDDAPAALVNLLRWMREETGEPIAVERRLLSPSDPNLADYPIAFIHGRQAFRWTDEERVAIRSFVDNGGVIIGDAICASREFAGSFRAELAAIFPDQSLDNIPTDSPLFGDDFGGFELAEVQVRRPRKRATDDAPLEVRISKVAPKIEGLLTDDGRYGVLFSPLDLSCAWENHASFDCQGYVSEDAVRIGVNLLLYAMQQ